MKRLTSLTSSRYLLLLSSFAALLSLGALVFLSYESARARAAVVGVQDEIAAGARREALGASIRAALAETRADREALAAHFVPEDGTVAFIEEMEALSRQARVELDIQSVAVTPAEQASLEVLRMVLSAKGSWQSVIHFLVLVDALPVVHTLTNVSLERPEGGKTWTLIMSIGTFKRKSP